MDPQGTALRMAMVGDIALGNHPKTPGFGFYSRYMNGIPLGIAGRILPPDQSFDVVFGNLEFPFIPDHDHPGTDACCLGLSSYAAFLCEAGFTVINVANNHAWDYGQGAFGKTIQSLKRFGIKVVGIPYDFDPAGFLNIKGRTIAFLGCSARPRQGFKASPGYNEFGKDRFIEKIREARRLSDLVCVSIHWGEEFLVIPSPWEREVARAMVDAGADVVVGHHPHVLREVESYRGGIIAYSLGNFIGDMSWNLLNRETGCLLVEANVPRNCSGSFFAARIEPDFFPRYLDEHASREALASQERRRANLEEKLETTSYESLARKALKKHQWLTLLFFLKNFFNYSPAILAKIISHGIQVRLPGLKR